MVSPLFIHAFSKLCEILSNVLETITGGSAVPWPRGRPLPSIISSLEFNSEQKDKVSERVKVLFPSQKWCHA